MAKNKGKKQIDTRGCVEEDNADHLIFCSSFNITEGEIIRDLLKQKNRS